MTISNTTHKFVMTDEYIAEAQRLSIAQNKTLKFFYQTWWVWWLPRIVIVVMIIVLYLINMGSTIAILGVALVLSFTGEWFGQWNLAKARKKVSTKGTAATVTMNGQGIDMEGANGSSHLKWSAMLQPAIYPDGVLIKFSRFAMVWLPDQALIGGSPADVRQLLAENVKDSSHLNQ
jgi:hypothetical protein